MSAWATRRTSAAILALNLVAAAAGVLQDDTVLVQHGIHAAAGVAISAGQTGDPTEDFPGIDLPDGVDVPPGVREEGAAGSSQGSVEAEKTPEAQDDFEPSVPVPSYSAGERAELVSTDPSNFGVWIACTVKGPSDKPGTYEVSLSFPNQQTRILSQIPGKALRKDKPDAQAQRVADEMDAHIQRMKKKYNIARPAAVRKAPAPAEPSGGKMAIAKLIVREMTQPKTTPAPLTPQKELNRWLGRHAENHNLTLQTLQKLHAMGQRPVMGLLHSGIQEAELAWDANLTFEEKLLLDPAVNGTYQISSTGQTFNIHNLSCRLLVAGIPDRRGNKLMGELLQQGEWFVANLSNQGHEPAGSIRFKRGRHPGKATISWSGTSAQRMFGQTGWGGDLPAQRINKTDDHWDGKCDYPAYGCHCTGRGLLQTPEWFFGEAGDDVEVFSSEGIGWYQGIILHRNQTDFKYTVFVPSEYSGARVKEEVTLEWLRKPRMPVAAPKEAQAELHEKQQASQVTAERGGRKNQVGPTLQH